MRSKEVNARQRTTRRYRAPGVVAWIVGGGLIVIALSLTWVGARGLLAYEHLTRIRTALPDVAVAVTRDPENALSTLRELAAEANAARELTSDWVWAAAEPTPWIGPQLAAFRTIAASSDRFFGESLLPLATAAQALSIDALRPANGRLDAAVLDELVAPAQSAAVASAEAAAAVDQIDRTPLIGSLGSAVEQADDIFARAADSIDALSRTSQLLPAMLGRDAPRSYLLLVQNNAEWRSLGGITGTAILLRTDQGAVTLEDTRSATALSRGLSAPVTDLPADVEEIYGGRPARFFHNLTQVPDFTLDGPLARQMYAQQTGRDVDGVIAVDPVALSYLLRATGPVSLADGEQLTADNAVSLLMRDVYDRYSDPAAQDAFFAGASGAVFNAFLEGKGSTPGLVTALARAVDERRVLFWSADVDEQAVIDGTSVAGHLPSTDERTARFGVYFNDGTGSKMSFYLKPAVVLEWGSCTSSRRELTLTVNLLNTAPEDAGRSLPTYVTGNGAYGTPPGSATTVSNIYLPEGWDVVSASTTSGTGFTEASLQGRSVLTFGSTLAPQSSATIAITVRSAPGASAADAEAFVTPTADAALRPTVQSTCVRSGVATLE